MKINFIPREGLNNEALVEVHLGSVLYGYIVQIAPKTYHYYRLKDNRSVPRYKSDNVSILKQLVSRVP
jgi:hypothetical protein